MFEFNSDTRNLKYQVLLEVATLAFASQLEEKVEEIPYKIINTDVPPFPLLRLQGAGNHSGTNSRRHGTGTDPPAATAITL